jgi:hypothetical protein
MLRKLWWVAAHHPKSPESIETAFPRRQACSADDPDPFDMTDVLERIIWKVRSGKINYSGKYGQRNLIVGIIDECFGTWMDTEKKLGQEFRFLDMFNISISRIEGSRSPPSLHIVIVFDTYQGPGR